MTKRRPSWSERRRQAAALICGLLLLNVSPVSASGGKPSTHHKSVGQAAPKAKHGKAAKARPAARQAPRSEILAAELMADEAGGLRGAASFYAYGFQGRRTATGEAFNVRDFTAASNHFPLGTMVAVRRLDNNLCAIVKINDRMHAKHRKRIIDVSRGVAEYLDMIRAGVVLVGVAPLRGGWRQRGLGACEDAFEVDADCPLCDKTPRLPSQVGELPESE